MNFRSSSKLCILIATLSVLAACTQDPEKRGREANLSIDQSPSSSSTSTETATGTDTASGASTSTSTDSSATTTVGTTSTDTSSAATTPTTAASTTPAGTTPTGTTPTGTTPTGTTPTTSIPNTTTIAANPTSTGPQADASVSPDKSKVNINLNTLPENVPICSVAGTQITVGDYKRMMLIQQGQTNQLIVSDPNTKARLLKTATDNHITLSDAEKKKLVEASHQQKGMDAKAFADFLKQTNTTEQQFDNEIMQTGLAFKVSNAIIEKTLLPELVNRALLGQAASEGGGEKTAMNKYLAFKHTKAYEQLKAQTGMSEDALKKEIVAAELAKVQLAKIQAASKITEPELKKLFEANKAQLKHGERIRLSSILILCPEKDIGPIQSVRTQLAKAYPKLSEKELDEKTAAFLEQAKQKSQLILSQAKYGADFAKLANENSNDPLTMQKKNGGDMGFVEKSTIIPQLADAVGKLKPGQVLEQTVKTELGYNIYKVTGKEPPGNFKYEDVKAKLAELGKEAKSQQMLQQWLEQRRKVVRIEFTPQFLAIANGK